MANSIKENEIKDLIDKGYSLTLELVYNEEDGEYIQNVVYRRKRATLKTWKGFNRVIKDPTRAIDWAKKMGFCKLKMEIDLTE